MDPRAAHPFGPVRDGLPASYPRPDDDAACDGVGIGAGITGAQVAHRLTEAGVGDGVLGRPGPDPAVSAFARRGRRVRLARNLSSG